MADKFLGPTGLARLIAHIKTALKEIQENSGVSGDYVPTSRKVNNHALDNDVTLTAADVGAAEAEHTHTAADVGALAKGEALEFGGSKGEAGQVLTSQGDSQPPIWATPSGGSGGGSWFGECSTNRDTAEKEVTVSGGGEDFSLSDGVRVTVRFSVMNQATNPKLNVNGTGAKPIVYGYEQEAGPGAWFASNVLDFVYNASAGEWVIAGDRLGIVNGTDGYVLTSRGNANAPGWKPAVGKTYQEQSHGEIFNNYSLNKAPGSYSHAEGYDCNAKGNYSHAAGFQLVANDYQTVVGTTNKDTPKDDAIFIVGAGSIDPDDQATAYNALRVNLKGVWAGGEYNSSGADYAELFEWADGNPDAEDRAGKFVALDGEKVHLCGTDEKPLGIISAVPAVIGDVYDDQWHGMYQTDVFGRLKYEMQTVRAVTDEEGNEIVPEHQELRPVLNPDYRPEEEYVPRSKRPEWATVGFFGKLVVVDDGSCEPNGYCKPSDGGVATASEAETPYRVMARIDGTHIRVLALPIV